MLADAPSGSAPKHHSRVLATPWPGVYGTELDSARHFGRHWHATYGVGLLETGAQRSASGRGVVDAHAGNVITTNPGEVHDGRPLGGPSRRWRMLYLDPAAMASMQVDTPAPELARPVIDDPALRGALQQLFRRLDAWQANRPCPSDHALACEEALARACGLLLARHASATPPRAADADMRRVRERLGDERLAPPTLAELAQPTGLSRYQLLRRFEAAYGMPPHAWLRQQRAERAREHIRRGASLVQAAAASGFADQSHMTRCFVRQFGFTPGAWRRAALQ